MKRSNIIMLVLGILAAVGGGVLVYVTRAGALAEDAALMDQLFFALSLIVTAMGILLWVVAFLPRRQISTKTLALAAIFAALCYIGFTYGKIDIPVGGEKTAFHLGNVFCVLAALFLGGFWGGMSGAVGMTIADLTTGYVTSAPKTFLLKLGIGLITGLLAHKLFHISREKQRLPLPAATVLSCIGGMAFNVVADPLVGYFYKLYLLGVPQDAANIWAKMGAVTTAVNAVVAVIAATVLYLALRPALRHARLLPKI